MDYYIMADNHYLANIKITYNFVKINKSLKTENNHFKCYM